MSICSSGWNPYVGRPNFHICFIATFHGVLRLLSDGTPPNNLLSFPLEVVNRPHLSKYWTSTHSLLNTLQITKLIHKGVSSSLPRNIDSSQSPTLRCMAMNHSSARWICGSSRLKPIKESESGVDNRSVNQKGKEKVIQSQVSCRLRYLSSYLYTTNWFGCLSTLVSCDENYWLH